MAGVKRTLGVDLGGLLLPTPVVIASGCAGAGRELAGLVDARKLGGIVSRSVTVSARRGSPTPRITECASGIVWSTGLQNPGVAAFIADELPRLVRTDAPVVVSIAGGALEEYVRVASLLQGRSGLAAIEMQMSRSDDEMNREVLAANPERAGEVAGAVARMSAVPVFAKLPLVSDLVEVARACVRAGVTGLTLIDAVPALSVDVFGLRPELGAVTGWLSGPAIKPLALRAVFDVAQAMPDVPIFGCGGIRTATDAVQMLLAGAWAVQVGTAAIIDPAAPAEIAVGVLSYLKEKGLASPSDLRTHLRVPVASMAHEEPSP